MLRSINCNKAISPIYKLKHKLTDSILIQQLAPLEQLLEQQLFGSVAAVEAELLIVDELVVEYAAVAGLVVVVAAAAAELVAAVGLEDAIVVDDVELIQDVAKLYFVRFPRRPQHSQSNQDQLL